MDPIVFANVYVHGHPTTHACKQTSRDPRFGAPLSRPFQAWVASCNTIRYPAAVMLIISAHFVFYLFTLPYGSPSTNGQTHAYQEAVNFATLLQFRPRMPPRGKPCKWDSFVPTDVLFLLVWYCRPIVRMHPLSNSFEMDMQVCPLHVQPALCTEIQHRRRPSSTSARRLAFACDVSRRHREATIEWKLPSSP